MTEIKATPAEDCNTVTVKMSKLTEGIGIVFAGVLTMLEALDASTASKIADALAEKKAEPETQPAATEGNEDENEGTADRSETADDASADGMAPAEPADEAVDEEPVEERKSAKKTQKAKKEQTEQSASTLSKDDITKVIVQKIKHDRSNSAKVESILKTYGVAKVSELPAEKYEAFMTDIAQL